MTANITVDGRQIDARRPIDISIPLKFNGPQPNAFGAARAISHPCQAGDLVGDTRHGGSCNFEQYTFIPHCNGTHTECVGHITHQRISVSDCLQDVVVPAILVSVNVVETDIVSETYVVPFGDGDRVISRTSLEDAVTSQAAYAGAPTTPAFGHPSSGRRGAPGGPTALIVRTLPNHDSKLTRAYGEEPLPPYFTTEAMEYIVERGVNHLLVDVPSIDRMNDEGKLSNHRIFWNVDPGSFETKQGTRAGSTITELIYVPNNVDDGEYALNLQIAPFAADASPSRPLLFRYHAD
jgi:arylformamidase